MKENKLKSKKTRKNDLVEEVYRRILSTRKNTKSYLLSKQKQQNGAENPRSEQYPVLLCDIMNQFTDEMGWSSFILEKNILTHWNEIAGEINSQYSKAESVEKGVLIIRCTSTAWATQLRFMKNDFLKKIYEMFPESNVNSIRFNGPDVPSWKKGIKSIPGRGPRDTYG